MKTRYFLFTAAVLAGLLAVSGVCLAQTAEETADASAGVTAAETATDAGEAAAPSDETAATEETGTEEPNLISPAPAAETAEAAESAPSTSGWSLFWRGVRERVSIALTLDPVKKAEKQVIFAEERVKIAEAIAEKSDDPSVQARAQKMIERASQLMEKVEAKKEKWLEKKDERAEKLLERAANQYAVREKVMEKLEAKLAPEQLEKFEALKVRAVENNQRLLNAIQNPNISEETKAHLEEIKARVEDHAADVKAFRDANQELLEKAAAGDEAARTELKQVQQQRVELRQEAKDIVKDAVQARQEVREEVRAERQEVREEVRAERKQIRDEVKAEIQQIRKGAATAPETAE